MGAQDAWTQVDLNDGQWDQVQVDAVDMSYQTQGSDASH